MRRPVDKEIGRDQPAERLSNARRVGHERKELGEEERAVVLPALAIPEADTHSCVWHLYLCLLCHARGERAARTRRRGGGR